MSVLFALCLVMVITCPKAEDHREAIKQELVKTYESANANESESSLVYGLGKLLVKPLTEMVVNQMLEVHNYILFSTSTFTWEGEERTLSFGILGHVFTFTADSSKALLEEGKDGLDADDNASASSAGKQRASGEQPGASGDDAEADSDQRATQIKETLNDSTTKRDIRETVQETRRAAKEAAQGAHKVGNLIDKAQRYLENLEGNE